MGGVYVYVVVVMMCNGWERVEVDVVIIFEMTPITNALDASRGRAELCKWRPRLGIGIGTSPSTAVCVQ